jgi:CO dehydrogenase/acetyl-CoA synthase epsilon subunit
MFTKPQVMPKEELSNMRKLITDKLVNCYTKQIQKKINNSHKQDVLVCLGPVLCSQKNLKSELFKLNKNLNLKTYDIIDDAMSEIQKDLESSGFTVVDITKHYPKSFKLLIKITW